MQIKILKKATGNCGCAYCGRVQEGIAFHPYTLWHKADDEKRGHNDPVCSLECAESLRKEMVCNAREH